MTDEVEAQPTTEVDFAMQYAKERKERMDTEVRLFALIHEVVPFLVSAGYLVEAIVERNTDRMAEEMQHLTAWSGDIEFNLLLNVYRPAGPTKFFKKGFVPKGTTIADFPQETIDRIHDVVCAASKSTADQWNNFAQEFDLLPAADFSNRNMDEFTKLLKKHMLLSTDSTENKVAKHLRDFVKRDED